MYDTKSLREVGTQTFKKSGNCFFDASPLSFCLFATPQSLLSYRRPTHSLPLRYTFVFVSSLLHCETITSHMAQSPRATVCDSGFKRKKSTSHYRSASVNMGPVLRLCGATWPCCIQCEPGLRFYRTGDFLLATITPTCTGGPACSYLFFSDCASSQTSTWMQFSTIQTDIDLLVNGE